MGCKNEINESTCTEIYVDGDTINVTIYKWANGAGASIMVHGVGAALPVRMTGSFLWEELDVIALALSAAIEDTVINDSALIMQSELEKKYHELLMAVGKKYPNESRHETALRYIREREEPNDDIAKESK